VVFTYNKALYNPSDGIISDDLLVHEMVHVRQQGNDSESWWHKYLNDQTFRLSQELEAYEAQYAFYKQRVKDRNAQARFLHKIALDLSSAVYGNMITYTDAKSRLK